MSDTNKTSLEGGQEENAANETEERDASLSLKGGMGVPAFGWAKGAQSYLGDVRGEFKKISWPTRRMVFNETIIVLIFVVVLTTLITMFDWIFTLISNRFLV
ncbi:preprotein translocase subunit SecE [compost metagenome]